MIFLTLVAILFSVSASPCDELKIYPSDDYVKSYNCDLPDRGVKKICFARLMTMKGREYLAIRIEPRSGRVFELYKWFDRPNNTNAKFFENDYLFRAYNSGLDSPNNSFWTNFAEYHKLKNKLTFKVELYKGLTTETSLSGHATCKLSMVKGLTEG